MNKTYDEKVAKIKKSVGTEYLYDSGEGMGYVLPAVVAAFDPEIGFTCLATHHIDEGGHDWSRNEDKNGNICLIGLSHRNCGGKEGMINLIYEEYLPQILAGRYTSQTTSGFASCSF